MLENQRKVSDCLQCAGDSLNYHNGQPFTTKDRDNDKVSHNCANQWHGAWWYKTCHYSNLNGRYRSVGLGDPSGLDWRLWKNAHYSMKRTSMKLCPN